MNRPANGNDCIQTLITPQSLFRTPINKGKMSKTCFSRTETPMNSKINVKTDCIVFRSFMRLEIALTVFRCYAPSDSGLQSSRVLFNQTRFRPALWALTRCVKGLELKNQRSLIARLPGAFLIIVLPFLLLFFYRLVSCAVLIYFGVSIERKHTVENAVKVFFSLSCSDRKKWEKS